MRGHIAYNIGVALTGIPPFSASWICLSPGYAPWLVGRGFGTAFPADFWPSLAMTVVWTLACLWLAAYLLARNWRDDPGHHTPTWRERWRTWRRGSARWGTEVRTRLLERNPFQWLAQRDDRPVILAWSAVIAVVCVWFFGWPAWPSHWLTTTNLFLVATCLILLLLQLEWYSAGNQVAHDRRSSMLEFLLTTRLTPADIVDGQIAAVHAQFRWPRRAVLLICMALMISGFFSRPWNLPAIFVYLVIWSALWVLAGFRETPHLAIWIALNTGRSAFSLPHTQGFWMSRFLVASLFLLPVINGVRRAAPFPTGALAELWLVPLALLIVLIIVLDRRNSRSAVRARCIEEMREIARQPIPDRDDPRYKKWKDLRQRFPFDE